MPIRRRPPNPAVKVEYLHYQVPHSEAQPLHILEEIVWHKEVEVEKLREALPLLDLQKKVRDMAPPLDFLAALRRSRHQPALIAEVKKASPSKGIIRPDFDPRAIAAAYERGGAACISVLTDAKFFQGSFANLTQVRQVVNIPLLCKEFIIYPYQLYLARSEGADAVLLIAAILSDQDLEYFLKITATLGMTALIEVHTLEELDRVLNLAGVQLVGINNRNLENFTVDIQTTATLLAQRQDLLKSRDILVVSESGIHSAEDMQAVSRFGAQAVLVGESLIKQADLEAAIAALLKS
jgi:indole-3-glycerol phosphate synthase